MNWPGGEVLVPRIVYYLFLASAVLAVWLPDMKIVAVGPDADTLEVPPLD